MSKNRVWTVRDGIEVKAKWLTFEITNGDQCIDFAIGEVDNLIEILRQVKAHHEAQRLAEEEAEKLARWGKAKVKCD